MTTTIAPAPARTVKVIRHREVDPGTLTTGPWDGRNFSYIPPENLRIPARIALHDDFETEVDPVTYQVIRWKLWSMNLEHSDTIKKVAGSPLIVFMDDFNTSLLTEDGDNLVCGPSVQYFTGLSDLVVKWTLENRGEVPGIEDGDVFYQNDPYIGTAHQMDAAIYAPVYWEGRLFSWIFSSCHQGDIGGIAPGSFCVEAPDIFSESTPVPPIKLARGGVLQTDVAEMLTRKSRMPDMVALQLRSQMAGLHATSARMLELLGRYGPRTVKGVMRRMIWDCAEAVGRRLESIPDGAWQEAVYAGSIAPGDRDAHRLSITVRKSGDQMICSNLGTDPQFWAANCTYGAMRSALISSASTLLAYDQMYCPAGVLAHMQFEPVPGTLNCAAYPGAVTPLTGAIIGVYLASQAMSRMLLSGPEEIRNNANASGGVSLPGWWVMSGLDRNGRFVADLTGDSLNGSIGAFPWRDGVDTGGAWWWPRSLSGDAEEWEQALPMLYLYRREQMDSGGPGRWRGGNGVEIAAAGHKTAELNVQIVSSDPALNTSPGLAGGFPGHSGNHRYAAHTALLELYKDSVLPSTAAEIEEQAGAAHRVNPKEQFPLLPNDIVIFEYSAGGGFGDPLYRDPGRVAKDIADRAVSPESARHHYGVVIDAAGAVDDEATTAVRASIRRERLAQASAPVTAAAVAQRKDIIHQAGDGLAVAYQGASLVWACDDCGRILGGLDQNFKLGAARSDRRPPEVDPVMYPDPADFCDVAIVFRQFYCPGCAQLLSTEICRETDEPMWDFRLESESLKAMRRPTTVAV